MRVVLNYFLPVIVIVTAGCTKTVGPEPPPVNEILSYKVTNLADTVIYGAIDNTDHTITVYIPFYYGLNVIDPELTLSEGATLVEEVLPVPVNSDKTVYTVKGKNGQTMVYNLKIVQQNISELTVQWSQPGTAAWPMDDIPVITGNFMSTNRALIGMQLTHHTTGATVIIDPKSGAVYPDLLSNWYILNGIRLSSAIDTGYYSVKIIYSGHHKTLSAPLHVEHRQPNFLASTKVVQQGGTISFRSFSGIFLNPDKAVITIGTITWPATIEQFSPEEITLKLPDDLPAGDHSAAYSISFEGWKTVTRWGSLTVTSR